LLDRSQSTRTLAAVGDAVDELSRRRCLGRIGVLYGAASAGPVLWKRPGGGGGGQTFPMSAAPMSTITVEGGARIPERAPWSAHRYNDHSLLLIHVDPPGSGGTTTLTVRAVSATGSEFDRVTLLRRRDLALPAEPPAA
jgi:hypothetical protein